jgi:hypothetical protein
MMKGIVIRGLVAVALAALGTVALRWSSIERDLAQAEERMATLSYAGVDEVLERAERFYERVSTLPLVGVGKLSEIKVRRAAVRYWQGDYAALVPSPTDGGGAATAQDEELGLIAANAVYRMARDAATTPGAFLQALDAGIAAQLAVLKSSARNEDAAFNYEYLLRLRAAAAVKPDAGLGTGEPGTERTTHGQPGGAPRQSDPSDFKIHIPLEAKEFEYEAQGQQAGKAAVRERRG